MDGNRSTRRGRRPAPRARNAAAAVVLAAAAALLPAHADEALDALLAGGHVALVRHALAPGTGDPPDFAVDDCATQRNLSEAGRAQARRIGAALREAGLAGARVYSSEWCRCLETARLLGLGPVEPLPALNSFFQRPAERAGRVASLRAFLSALDGTAPVVLVTHQVTISAMTGTFASSGEVVVAELDAAALRAEAPLPVTGRMLVAP